MLMARWTSPTCSHMGVKNLKVWSGSFGFGKPPQPQICSREHSAVELLLRQVKETFVIEGTSRMHPVKRAPRLMSISDEGPSILLSIDLD